MLSKLFALNAYVALAAAAILTIDVPSPSGALTFSPNSVTANQGDTIVFNWQAGGHSVVQGQGSSAACQPAAGGFFGGFQEPPTTFAVEVNNTNPIWFYCSTPGHCQVGMVGVINPPSDVTIQDYARAAASALSNPSPDVPAGFGGVINKNGFPSSSSSSTSGGSSTQTSSSSEGSTSTTPTTSSGSGSGFNPSVSGGGSTTSASSQETASSGQPASHNNGWIAGIVIGAVAGLAIIIGVGYLIWYLHRRLAQNQTERSPTEQKQRLPLNDQPLQPTSPVIVHELPAMAGVEMPAGNHVTELHG